mmetsp:Transcript_2252/g.6233  ORF Transcript_2252/g.6233 Transcript_2252/m.6233 type:complete len:87 (+) Transcript_2252:710-970(+)
MKGTYFDMMLHLSIGLNVMGLKESGQWKMCTKRGEPFEQLFMPSFISNKCVSMSLYVLRHDAALVYWSECDGLEREWTVENVYQAR